MKNGLICRLARLQPGGEFEAVSRHDPIIVIGCGYQVAGYFTPGLSWWSGE